MVKSVAATDTLPTDGLRARYEQLLRGDVPLAAEMLEPTLRLQYDLQVRRMVSLGLVEEDEDSGERSLTAIDGRRYPLPSFDDVLARMQTPEVQQKLSQGFDTLLLVPFGLDLLQLIEAWRHGLRKNAGRVGDLRNLNQRTPVRTWDEYQSDSLVYDPQHFAPEHGGRTKSEILREEGRGWEVLLVEGGLLELPREGQGKRLGGRGQLECGRTVQEYLAFMPEGEVGWTPETYIIRFLDALERSGIVLDRETYSLLTGAYVPSSRYVPRAFWDPGRGLALLDGEWPGIGYDRAGARAAVRVG